MRDPEKARPTRRPIRRVLTRLVGALVALGIGALLVLAWLPKPVPVDIVHARRGPMQVTVNADGRTRVKARHIIAAPLSGNLLRVELEPGDPVEVGTILARIVPLDPPLLDSRTRAQAEARRNAAAAAQRQAQAAIARAQAAREFAAREAERQEQLLARGSVSPQVTDRARLEARAATEELTAARFGRRVADYELRMAEAAVKQMSGKSGPGEEQQLEIPSPVAGRVLKIMRQSEGAVQVGTPLLEIGDPSALEIVVDVLSADAVHVRPGQTVRVEQWGGDAPLAGHVRLVEPSAFSRVSALGVEEQRVNVIIDLDDPREKWDALGDGFRVETRIVVWEADDVLRVPVGAVFRYGDGWAVYDASGDVAKRRPVEIGRRSGVEVQIEKGLEANAAVIAHPSDRVAHETAIVPR